VGLKLIELGQHSLDHVATVFALEGLELGVSLRVVDVVVTWVGSPGDWGLSELLELLQGVVLEHVGVGEEPVVGGHVLEFDHGHLSGLVEGGELVLEKGDSIHGFIVLSDPQNEDVRRLTSLILQGLDKVIDGGEPASDPLQIRGSVSDLALDVLTVGDGGVVDSAVGVGDTLEIRDGPGKVVFLLIVLLS